MELERDFIDVSLLFTLYISVGVLLTNLRVGVGVSECELEHRQNVLSHLSTIRVKD